MQRKRAGASAGSAPLAFRICGNGSARNAPSAASAGARRDVTPPCLAAQFDQPRPWKFRPPAEPSRQRRKGELEGAPRTVSAPIWLTRISSPPGFNTRMKSSSVPSGSGTAVMTYCATTASKKASLKARFFASITASVSTFSRLCERTRCCALRSIGSEISTPHTLVVRDNPTATIRCRRRRRGCGRRSDRPPQWSIAGRRRTPCRTRGRRPAPSAHKPSRPLRGRYRRHAPALNFLSAHCLDQRRRLIALPSSRWRSG